MGTETLTSNIFPLPIKSGRDIPRYGDGNKPRGGLSLVSPEGTSPGMGTETMAAARKTVFKRPEGTSPGMGTETLEWNKQPQNESPEGTSPGMGTETIEICDPVLVLSGRDIPRYGDGNVKTSRSRENVCPEGTSPGMGTETVLLELYHTISESPEGTSPGMGTETLFCHLECGIPCPEGTSPGMGTETKKSDHDNPPLSVRDIPRYGDGNFSTTFFFGYLSGKDIPGQLTITFSS